MGVAGIEVQSPSLAITLWHHWSGERRQGDCVFGPVWMLRSVRTSKFNHTGCFAGQSPLKKGLRPQRQELIHPCEQAYEKDVGGEMWLHFFRPRMRVMSLVFAGMAIRTTITAAETKSDSRS